MGTVLSINEPTLEEMLSEPIVALQMLSDKVTKDDIRLLMQRVSQGRDTGVNPLLDDAFAAVA